MRGVQAAVGHTLAQGDLSNWAGDIGEAPADRVGALAFTGQLESALFRYKMAGDRTQRPKILLLMARAIWKRREPARVIAAICERVLDEHMKPTCPKCNGTGRLESYTNTVRVCTSCNGTGLAQHSTHARMRALKCSENAYNVKWQPMMARAHNVLANAETNAARRLSRQLERNKTVATA